MIYKMTLADSADSMTFDLLEVPIADKDVEGAVDNTLVNGNVFTDYLWLKKQWTQKWALMCPDEYEQLRGFYTRQWENAEAPTYRLFYGNNIDTYDTQSGDYILANIDAPLGAEMSLTQLSGNAEQTTYSGKNLLQYPAYTGNTTVQGVTFTQSADNKVTASGTTSAGMNWYYWSPSQPFVPTTSGTYTLSFVGTKTNVNFVCYDLTTSSTAMAMWASNPTNTATGTLTAGHNYQIYFNVGSSGVAVTINGYGQLELGSTATTYEPYVGGTASPNPDYPQAIEVVTGEQTVEIVSPKKNLANPQRFIDWIKEAHALCSQYAWGNETNRPVYGTFYGRTNVVRFNGASLYTSRNSMSNPTYLSFVRGIFSGMFETGKQYTISFDMYSTHANGYSNMAFYQTDGTVKQVATGGQNQWTHISTYSANGKSVASVGISYQAGTETYIDLDTLQIEEGISETTYTPFVGKQYEINLGKNLFNVNRTEGTPSSTSFGNENKRTFNYGEFVNGISMNNYYSGNNSTCSISDGVITVNSTQTGYGAGFAVKAKPNTNYVATFTKSTTALDDVRVSFYKADGTFISYSGTNSVAENCFITPAECDFFLVIFRPTQGVETTYSNVQIEEGILPTSYSDYFTPIELAKIGNYQDRIYKNDGKWYIEKQVGKAEMDGSENITEHSTKNSILGVRLPVPSLAVHAVEILNNYFQNVDFATFYGDTRTYGTICAHSSQDLTNIYASAPNSSVTTVAQFQTWLSTHNTTVYYALATPTTTEITDDALLAQLNTISELYGGQNNIMLTPYAGAQGTMEVKIHSIYERETEIYPQTAVRLTLTDDGIINPCGCRRNVQIKMRETIQ